MVEHQQRQATRVPFWIKYLLRTTRLAALSTAFALRFWFRGTRGPELLRKYFERCGGAYVKLGQILAMRYDILPMEYCDELAKLLDKLPPVPVTEVLEIIERELGKPLSELFVEFDRTPLSAASVAQVHRAKLSDDTRVVVKVRRPGIEQLYRADLLNGRIVLVSLKTAGLLQNVDIDGLIAELRQLAKEELDFHAEARNIYILHDLMNRDSLDHHSPQVYLSHSSSSVVTMEELQGVWLTEILEAINRGDHVRLEAWAQERITPERTARLLLRSILRQCFTYHVFHADPHAANLIVMNGGTLGYVDFGMIGWVDERSGAKHFKINQCIAEERIHGAYEALLELAEPLPNRDLSSFESDFKRLVKTWLLATKVPDSPLQERSGGVFFMRLFDLMHRENVRMPIADLRLTRALIISDIIVLKLYPTLPRIAELRAYFNQELQREFEARLGESVGEAALQKSVLGLLKAAEALPRLSEWVFDRLPQMSLRYRRGLSRFQRASEYILQQARVGSALAAVGLLGCRIAVLAWHPKGGLAVLGSGGAWWWLAVVATVFAFGSLTGLLRRMREG